MLATKLRKEIKKDISLDHKVWLKNQKLPKI
jgi:hypothetical protein